MMGEEERWLKVREIVREEMEASEKRILAALGKSKAKLALTNGRWVGVTEEQMNAWRDANPGIDIDAELKKMAAWIVSNPMMAPKSQLGRFVNSWLAREQNRLAIRSIPAQQKPTEHKMKHCEYCPKIATGAPGGIWACSEHFSEALDRKPRGHMWGVVAKPVAGGD